MDFEVPPSFWPVVLRLSAGNDEAALQRVVAEGLLSLVLWDESAPASLRAGAERFRALDATNRVRVNAFEESLRTLLDIFDGEPVIVMKGTDYAYRFYPAPHLRPRQDIDVLIRRDRAKALASLLRRKGFEQHFPAGGVSRLESYHEAIFVVGNATIELHHSFVQRIRNRIDYEGMWQRAKQWNGFDARLLQFEDADALLCHAINMSTDQFSTPLFRLLDVWLMLRGREEILAAAVARAKEWSVARALYGALRQASRHFVEMQTPAMEAAMNALLPERTRRFLDDRILQDPWKPRIRYGRAGQLWRKFWLIDAVRRRALFALYHVYALGAGSLLTLTDGASSAPRGKNSRG